MVFPLTEEQEMIRENVLRICADFGDDYWLARDEDGEFRRTLPGPGGRGIFRDRDAGRVRRQWARDYRGVGHGAGDIGIGCSKWRCVLGLD